MSGLQDSEEIAADDTKPRPPERRKWKRWVFGGLLVALIGGLLWLNGPGIRWLAPKIARSFLSKSGLEGSFELEGSLTGGLRMKDVKLEGDGFVAELEIGSVTPEYRLGELRKGKLRGIDVDGLHAKLRFGVETEKSDKDPLNLEKMVKTLRSVRGKLVPMNVEVTDMTLDASFRGEPLISLDSSQIHHQAGEEEFVLDLGTLTDATGNEWPARDSSVVWNGDQISVDRLDPLPGISIRKLVVGLPESGGPSLETELHVEDAVFSVNASPGLATVQVHLREGRLASETVADRFNLKLPASGELSSLTLNVERLFPDPKKATGSAQVLLENLAYDDWRAPELSLDVALETGRATLAARGVALDNEFSLNAEADVNRLDGEILLGEIRGRFNEVDVPKLIAGLAEHVEAIDREATVPASTVDAAFSVAFSNNRPSAVDVTLNLTPAESEVASAFAVHGVWRSDESVTAELKADRFTADVEYDAATTRYRGRVVFDDFKSARIDPWLEIVKIGTQRSLSVTGSWSGRGSLRDGTHFGTLALTGADVVREGVPQVHAQGEVAYDWPGGFTTEDLQVTAAEQRVAVDLKMADGFLEMSNLLWSDGDEEMAAGAGRLPVPEDFSTWRDMFANDERPLEVSIQSKVLPLARLKDWFPAAEKLDPGSTGQVELKVSGTYAKPEFHAVVEARNLRSPVQSKFPTADLKVTLAASGEHVAVVGSVTTPDFPPAVFTASMPFRPAEWAEKPGRIQDEEITARLDLPRIDLSRLASLVPGVAKLSGFVTGNVDGAGTVGDPVIKGTLDLVNGGLVMEKSDIPPVSGLGASVDFVPDRITLKRLNATVAGGTLSAVGWLEIDEGKPGTLEFRARANQIPLKRDESLIVRANADLRLTGTWEQAALTGTVGVVNSLFFRDIELLPMGSPFTGPEAAELPRIDTPAQPEGSVPEPFRDWTLNVLARTENPFLIRGNLATGQAVGSVRIRGTIGSPAPDGVVTVSEVLASLPFSTLTVRSGTLRFTPESGFDPILEIRGSAEPRPYRVNAYVYGRASDPQLVLTSSPPLPENEIMTLLATGTTSSGLEDPQAASSRALQLFVEELRRGRFGVGKQLRPLLKLLDRVDFSLAEEDPYSSESYSTATLKITDRWFLSAGMGSEGDSRVLAIWRLRFY